MVAFLVAFQFVRSKDVAREEEPGQIVCCFRVFFLQSLYQTVHFCACQEVHYLLSVLYAELFQALQTGRVYGQYNLLCGIFVPGKAHTSLTELRLVYFNQYDVAEELHQVVVMLGVCMRDTERPFALWQAGHVGVQNSLYVDLHY